MNPKKIKLKIKHFYLGLFEDVKSLVMIYYCLCSQPIRSAWKNLALEKENQTFNLRSESLYILHRYLWATWKLNWFSNFYVQDDNQSLLRSDNWYYVWKGCNWRNHIWVCNCKKKTQFNLGLIESWCHLLILESRRSIKLSDVLKKEFSRFPARIKFGQKKMTRVPRFEMTASGGKKTLYF